MGSKVFMATWSYGKGHEIRDTLAYLAINTPVYNNKYKNKVYNFYDIKLFLG